MKVYKYYLRKCITCKHKFRPLKENQRHCSLECRLLKSVCQYCYKEFKYYWLKPRKFCSKKCSGLNQRIDKKTILCLNCNISFNVYKSLKNAKYCNRKCKDEYQKILFKGEKNPNYNNSKLKGIKRSPAVIEKIREGIRKSWKKPNRLIKYYESIERYKDKYGHYPMHSNISREKACNSYREGIIDGTIKQVTHGKCGYYISIKTKIKEYFHSSWEHIRMMELDEDDNVIFWTKKHKISIKLEDNRWYLPDFLIEYGTGQKVLEEVKGFIRDKKLFELKVKKAKEYIKKNNISEYKVNFMNHLK